MYLIQLVVLSTHPTLADAYTDVAKEQVHAGLPLVEADPRTNIISSPTLMLSEGNPAEIRVGRRIPFVTSTDGNTVTYERREHQELAVGAFVEAGTLHLDLNIEGFRWQTDLPAQAGPLLFRPDDGLLVIASTREVAGDEDIVDAMGRWRNVDVPPTRRGRRRALDALSEHAAP